MGVLFDPGFARHTGILSMNVEYIQRSISKFKNLGQRKNQYKMYYQKLLQLVNNNVGFCLGCMLWAVYIKSLGNQEIINNPCIGGTYDEREAVEEVDFSKDYFEQLKRDAKYYLNLDYVINPQYIKVLDVYRDFLILNEGFVNTKTTEDIKLPPVLKTPKDVSVINDKIQEVVKTGILTDLFELYGTIL